MVWIKLAIGLLQSSVRLFNLLRWPSWAVIWLAGATGAGLAVLTVNLLSRAKAAFGFIADHGWIAIQYGALWQVAELVVWGAGVLLCFMAFKVCEQILTDRYLSWADRERRARRFALPRGHKDRRRSTRDAQNQP
ncbi:hypothetical protein ACS3SW_00880 [Roseobacteraceae bacterium S113]